jgi:hypothetical protein
MSQTIQIAAMPRAAGRPQSHYFPAASRSQIWFVCDSWRIFGLAAIAVREMISFGISS